ncbi:MAG: GNAT family N-acetyltransferase [Nocardioides sp.]
METRKLELDDFAAPSPLSLEAFGPLPTGTPQPPAPSALPPGRHVWGTFDGARLVARVAAHEFSSWFGGREVTTCGVAGVAVSAEHRGQGLLHHLFTLMLQEATERGEAISTLYPTASGIYRPFGYEVIAAYDCVEIPTAELSRIRPAVGVRTRRATPDDVPAIKATYAAWAGKQNGPLTRSGPRFGQTDEELLADCTAVSLAVDADDQVVGYASWDRHEGYGKHSTIEVWDLIGLTADAYRALWAMAGSFASVTGTVRLRTSGADLARLLLPSITWSPMEQHHHPYMLRVNDVPAAFTGRTSLPGGGAVDFSVAGDRLGIIDGAYRLDVESGVCEQSSEASGPTFTTQGLALAYAGAQSCANLRMLGHLTGPTTHDAVLDVALGGRQVHIRDYF